MVKPEWGVKRTCTSCGAKFYDLQHDPIVCPKCDATVDPLATGRTPRPKSTGPVVKEAPAAAAAADDADDTDDDLDIGDDDDVLDIDEEDEDDDAAIEDVTELGEDDDDVLGVLDKVSDEGEETR